MVNAVAGQKEVRDSTLKNLCFSSWEVEGRRAGSFWRHCFTMSCSSCSANTNLQGHICNPGHAQAGKSITSPPAHFSSHSIWKSQQHIRV